MTHYWVVTWRDQHARLFVKAIEWGGETLADEFENWPPFRLLPLEVPE